MGTRFTHTPAPNGYDARIYDTTRRKSISGYFELPVVDNTLPLILPPFSRVHSRLVTMSGKTWLIWSPNSRIDAYYPGIRAPGHEVVMEEDKTKRRFDGHLGRFDPTKSPQHYDPLQPWLPFVRRDRMALDEVENTSLAIAWLVPTEPRAHRSKPYISRDQEMQNMKNQFGRRPRAPSPNPGLPTTKDESQPKKMKSSDIVLPQTKNTVASRETTSLPLASSSSPVSVVQTKFATLGNHSTDSRFLCFEGLPPDWETCRVWFYSMAVSSHFVWINRMFRTVVQDVSLIWVDMKSNDNACRLQGYLTHRTMADGSLVVGHFMAETTFNGAARDATHSWTRPPSVEAPNVDDSMNSPSSTFIPLEARLTSPGPSTPAPDVSLLHRAAVTLEEQVERPQRSRGGQRHRKHKAKQQQNS
ncbi:uncharacterized protein LACBIDRAFT_331931 [Laccaria bicolor S238N-H82]|uniref:Predicted protein n=1 Tax=Laccaria bicolor (strain S238N-H82 / ATCC MYA-4686) TaxID=486041 RepID=B0DR30_LACBS|nr:uncharacterized protein LACBIDRAFT_331931 [Laccaria bicolor S238N-H82]EDR02993.1 predicted protein [Laccaria bicolor S238N-H82]|eukprot:XP_001886416.1 predicted protein [Laccaria bicolor S238N-H82]